MTKLIRALVAILATLTAHGLVAEPLPFVPAQTGPGQSVHGGVGLIQTPTARFAAEGNLSMNFTFNKEYLFWSLSITPYPWVEGTARYTDVVHRLYSADPGFSGDQSLKDKGLDIKFRLLQESHWVPAIALGMRDFGGTGMFSSEFLVGSKRYGDFDFHAGIGWGYLGTSGNISNPLCKISDNFCDRPQRYSGMGGKIEFKKFFKGPAALFGGVEYQTPYSPLRVRLEYEGNDYSKDRAGVTIKQKTPWNVGAAFKHKNFDWVASFQRGNTFSIGVQYAFNMNTASQIKTDPPPRVLAESRPAPTQPPEIKTLHPKLMQEAGFDIKSFSVDKDQLTVVGTQKNYRDQNVAIERTGRVLIDEFPSSIKEIHVIEEQKGVAVIETVIDSDGFSRAATGQSLQTDVVSHWKRTDPRPVSEPDQKREQPAHHFDLGLYWTQNVGNPESFYIFESGISLAASLELGGGWLLGGRTKLRLLDNYDTFKYKVDNQTTQLPRVRTYSREYITRSTFLMDNAYVQWLGKAAPDVFVQTYGGYLELMYAGVGSEVLYRPLDSPIAVGFDINWVKQRSYKNELSLMDYSVVTGHANLYWQPSFFPKILVSAHAGQFLAKDRGVKLNIARRFNSGIVFGVHAAFTNVSAEEYGEGSFSKGFYLQIPFDLLQSKSTKRTGTVPWVPIARDGGQPLKRPMQLYDITNLRDRLRG